MSDLAYINNLWDLDATNNPVQDLDSRKKQFAFQIGKENFINLQKREDSKESELKVVVADIYQLIGLYNVFQGVWFQGVTQYAQQARCRDSIIPIILSVLVSVATIIGVHFRFATVTKLKRSFFQDKLESKILESRIKAFEHSGFAFEWGSKEQDSGLNSLYEKELEKLHRIRLLTLAFLLIASVLFASLIHVIMCHTQVT